jgi:hypothetical protein
VCRMARMHVSRLRCAHNERRLVPDLYVSRGGRLRDRALLGAPSRSGGLRGNGAVNRRRRDPLVKELKTGIGLSLTPFIRMKCVHRLSPHLKVYQAAQALHGERHMRCQVR